jgi:hypothetical protein
MFATPLINSNQRRGERGIRMFRMHKPAPRGYAQKAVSRPQQGDDLLYGLLSMASLGHATKGKICQ